MGNLFKRPIFWAFALLVVLSGIWIAFSEEDFSMPSKQEEGVALRVNETTFTIDYFNAIANQVAMERQMFGGSLSDEELKEMVVERLTQEALLMELAKKEGIEPTKEEMEKAFKDVMDIYEAENEEELMDALKNEGVSDREELNEILSSGIKIEKLLEFYQKDIEEVTPEEAKEIYEKEFSQMVEMYEMQDQEINEEDFPSFEEVESDIIKDLMGQRTGEFIVAKIEEMKEAADVEIYIGIEDLEIESADQDQMQMPIDPEQQQPPQTEQPPVEIEESIDPEQQQPPTEIEEPIQ